MQQIPGPYNIKPAIVSGPAAKASPQPGAAMHDKLSIQSVQYSAQTADARSTSMQQHASPGFTINTSVATVASSSQAPVHGQITCTTKARDGGDSRPTKDLPCDSPRKESPLEPLRRLFHAAIPHSTPGTMSPATDAAATPSRSPAASVSTEGSLRERYGRQCRVLGHGTSGTVRVFRRAIPALTRTNSVGVTDSSNCVEPYATAPQPKTYAVKEFKKRSTNEDRRAYMKRLTAEYCIASTLHHENIIETLDIVFENHRAYVIMDYCPHDLFHLLTGDDVPTTADATVDCYFSQLVAGVAYLHQSGIAHLDLKLENCVVSPSGILKIIDFGCAEVLRAPWEMRTRQCDKIKGSQPYVAPEVYAKPAFDGQCADVWAVGLMYICMVERHYPWRVARPEVDDVYRRYSEVRRKIDLREGICSTLPASLAERQANDDTKQPSSTALDTPTPHQASQQSSCTATPTISQQDTIRTATSGKASCSTLSREQGAGESGQPRGLAISRSAPAAISESIAAYMRGLLPSRPDAWQLLASLLNPDPTKRITMALAQKDAWLCEIETCHEHQPAAHHQHVGCDGPPLK